jgi:TATA-binding protein-associated factor Taf7
MITMLKNLILSFLMKRLTREIDKLEKKLERKRNQLQQKIDEEATDLF